VRGRATSPSSRMRRAIRFVPAGSPKLNKTGADESRRTDDIDDIASDRWYPELAARRTCRKTDDNALPRRECRSLKAP
jgi:hypothetical protein